MNDYLKDREIQRKRAYHKKWRAEHPENVKAAQLRYWMKKAAQMQEKQEDVETRTTGEGR